jgi:hypothetical protein
MPPGCGPCPRPLANSAATPAQPAYRPGGGQDQPGDLVGVGDRRGVAGANLHGLGADAVGHEPQPVWVDHPVTGAFLLAQLRRTLHLAPGAMSFRTGRLPRMNKAPGAAWGGGADRCPTCGGNAGGRVLTYSGVARPPPVPGLFQVSACASKGHGQAPAWHHLLRGRLAGASRRPRSRPVQVPAMGGAVRPRSTVEVVAEELGSSLRWATATTTRTTSSSPEQ